MTNKTFEFRIAEEIYEKLNILIENNGDLTKEWVDRVVANSKLQYIKKSAINYNDDLTQLEVYITGICELISNVISRSVYSKNQAINEVVNQLEQKEAIIVEYKEKMKEAESYMIIGQAMMDIANNKEEKISRQLDEARITHENNQLLINEYQDAIKKLKQLNEQKDYEHARALLEVELEYQKKLLAMYEENSAIRKEYESQILNLEDKLNKSEKSH